MQQSRADVVWTRKGPGVRIDRPDQRSIRRYSLQDLLTDWIYGKKETFRF